MLFSKFFVMASRDKTLCTVMFGDQPPTHEQMQKVHGEGAHLDDYGDLEQPLQKILHEVYTVDLHVGGEVILLWIYQFFVAGWNAANTRVLPYAQPMTVDKLRKLIVADQQHVAVRALADILRQLGFDFKDENRPSTREKVYLLLVGSFQVAFIIRKRGKGV